MKKTYLRLSLCLLLVTSMLTATVLPASAWSWNDWFGGGSGSSTTYTVFVKAESADGKGSGTVAVGAENSGLEAGGEQVTVKKGGTVEFMSKPDVYCILEGWYDEEGNLLSTELGFDLTNVQGNCTITAVFKDVFYDFSAYKHSHDGWTAWNDSDALPTEAGKYYLTTDVTINEKWVAPDGVAICLNGHIINNTGKNDKGDSKDATIYVSPFYQVIITDCTTWDEETYHYFNVNGIGQWVPSENNQETPYSINSGYITGDARGIYIADQGSLHMFGGAVAGVSGNWDGAGVSVSDGGIFYMYAGFINGNVNTFAGDGDDGISDYDGGGGLFVDAGAQAYLIGDATISYNTALYTNNGGGVYNYYGIVYLGEYVNISGNKGENGGASNYQSYGSYKDSSLTAKFPLDWAWVGISSTGVFAKDEEPFNTEDGEFIDFFSDNKDYEIKQTTEQTTGGTIYVLSNDKSIDRNEYVVTAGTRGGGSATVNGTDGAKGVLVTKNNSATLVATPASEDYMFIGWYDQNGVLVTTNPTYTISKVTSNKNMQAYFALSTEKLDVNGAGAYQIFNSGDKTGVNSSNSRSYRYKNAAFSTLTNENQYLYFHNNGSETYYDEEGPVGLPFTIEGEVLEKSVVTMNCYDVDESSGERDNIYLLDLTNHTKVKLGYLTGSNEKWTTTSFTVAPELLQEGHTYQLYLENTVKGWVAWIDTASISIGEMDVEKEEIPTVTTASITGSINSSRNVTGTLTVEFTEEISYKVEYKATHIETNNQLGYDLTGVSTSTVGTNTQNYSFTLESGAPEGAYRIDAYILDEAGNVLTTVNCTAGYSYVTVTYNANGGTNNVPEDTTAYTKGQTVTVKFDYTPTFKARSVADMPVFLGWARSADATNPEFTSDGDKTFEIGNSDVTLYAVYHTHTPGSKTIENAVPATCTEDGSQDTVYHCTECGEELERYTDVIPATGHAYGDWTVDEDATDDKEGRQHRVCANDESHVETVAIPAKGHTYAETIVLPTCTEQGYTLHECETCNDEYITDYVPALGHVEEIIPGKEPTCTETGLTDGTKCSRCDEILVAQKEISALGHNYVVTNTVLPTCTEGGYDVKTCTNCGDTYTDNEKDANGHNYEVSVVEPTCTTGGYTTHTCTNPVLGANGEELKDEDGYTILCKHTYTDNYTDPNGHTSSDWIIDQEAAEGVTGEKHRECVVCEEILEVAYWEYALDGNFDTFCDAGYYAPARNAADESKNGIIAFNTHYTGTLTDIASFGIWILGADEETSVKKTEYSGTDALNYTDGKFFGTLSGISSNSFDEFIYAKPYYVNTNGDVYFGDTVAAKVSAFNKWLGETPRVPTPGDIVGMEVAE